MGCYLVPKIKCWLLFKTGLYVNDALLYVNVLKYSSRLAPAPAFGVSNLEKFRPVAPR
jgi:hypothetical protein